MNRRWGVGSSDEAALCVRKVRNHSLESWPFPVLFKFREFNQSQSRAYYLDTEIIRQYRLAQLLPRCNIVAA